MSAVFTPTRHELSVEDCHKLSEAGILHEDSRVELIDGELMDLAPIGAAHMRIVNRLTRLLVLAVGDLGVVSIRNPITLPPHFEPQPDVVILSPGSDRPGCPVPGAEDVLLVVEVVDTTVAYDRNTTLRLYAEAWIVNVPAQRIEVYRDPVAGTPFGLDFCEQDRGQRVLPERRQLRGFGDGFVQAGVMRTFDRPEILRRTPGFSDASSSAMRVSKHCRRERILCVASPKIALNPFRGPR